MTVPCPSCGTDVKVPADVSLSEVVVCAQCDTELEVVAVDPLSVMLFEEEEK